jgi:Domain of unknown function (DUF4340)
LNRTQVVLIFAILGLASFYTWSKVRKIEDVEREFQDARYFPKVEEKDVEEIRVFSADPSFEYTLGRRGDHWYIGSHLLSLEKSHQLVMSILELSRDREMEARPTPDREAEFKLHTPAYILSVVANGGKELGTVKLGTRTPDYNHFYGQEKEGGAISTVPAYTLGILEEEPKSLHEQSLLPAEVAAVDLFSFEVGTSESVVLERFDETRYRFQVPDKGLADETRVKDFLFQLKDLKVARFLGPDEVAPAGTTEVQYRARVSYSEFEVVTELQQRVAANRKLVYGKRYLRTKDSPNPVEGTLERFVVELLPQGDIANPTYSLFEDRRVVVLDLDEVTSLTIEDTGETLKLHKDKQGKWTDGSDTNGSTDEAVKALLFRLKDLRYETSLSDMKEPKESALALHLSRKSTGDADLRFGLLENGKPYLWRESKGYSLSETSWEALKESVHKLLKPPTAAKKTSDESGQ